MNRYLVISLLIASNAVALTTSSRERLIDSLIRVETNGRASVIGDSGRAYGILQIHAITVAEANRIAGTKYTHREMFEPTKAREVARIVLGHYNRQIERNTGRPATAKQLAFIWNGGAAAWKRVNAPMNDTKQRNLEAYWRKVSKHYSE